MAIVTPYSQRLQCNTRAVQGQSGDMAPSSVKEEGSNLNNFVTLRVMCAAERMLLEREPVCAVHHSCSTAHMLS
jgi:hypothetical protein